MSRASATLRRLAFVAVGAMLAPFSSSTSAPHLVSEAHADVPGHELDEVADAITAMDVERAKTLLAKFDPKDPAVGYQLGRLGLETGDCDEAAARFAPPAVQTFAKDGPYLLEIARGCARAMAATIVVEDKEHQVLVRLQDDDDRAVVPLLGETIAAQRAVLEADLGVKMPLPTRVDLVRDQFTLAAMTGLPHKSAQTTGTVAIAKFGRVIMLSPRAPALGYGFRDTIAHELTHLALTAGTLDRAPLWLQEGVAKREETRWRPKRPTDDAIPPDAVAAAGLAKGLGRPLDGIGPSVAMLPSAKEATVVYAEVSSFVRFVAGDRAGQPGAPTDTGALPKIVASFKRGQDTDGALREVTGKDLAQWNAIWRPWVMTKGAKLPASLGFDDAKPASSTFDVHAAGRAVRLGELLLGRDHAKAARIELDPLAAGLLDDPLVAARIACARFRTGDAPGAKLAVADPAILSGDFGAWWAIRAQVLAALGLPRNEVLDAYTVAVAHDPYLPDAACGWSDTLGTGDLLSTVAKGLCVTAKGWARPR